MRSVIATCCVVVQQLWLAEELVGWHGRGCHDAFLGGPGYMLNAHRAPSKDSTQGSSNQTGASSNGDRLLSADPGPRVGVGHIGRAPVSVFFAPIMISLDVLCFVRLSLCT